MPVFNDLKLDTKYLINEFDGDVTLLVEPIMKTDLCILISIHEDVETFVWKKLNDDIFDIVEELTEKKSEEYDALFEDESEIEP
ncbi:MAG: hypothetical protein WCL56_11720 [Sediminibacterium sp.]